MTRTCKYIFYIEKNPLNSCNSYVSARLYCWIYLQDALQLSYSSSSVHETFLKLLLKPPLIIVWSDNYINYKFLFNEQYLYVIGLSVLLNHKSDANKAGNAINILDYITKF